MSPQLGTIDLISLSTHLPNPTKISRKNKSQAKRRAGAKALGQQHTCLALRMANRERRRKAVGDEVSSQLRPDCVETCEPATNLALTVTQVGVLERLGRVQA